MEQIITELWEHISIMNEEMGTIQIDVAILKAQMSQVLWLQRAVLVIVIGFVISKVLTKTFNNRNKNL